MTATTPAPLSPATQRLSGIGLGPGDPELITLKAQRLLITADVILVPQTADGPSPGRAEQVVLAAAPDRADALRRVPFSMSRTLADREGTRDDAAAAALAAFDEGARHVAVATVGDPGVYATFTYVAERVAAQRPGVQIDVIPGITAMQALAAASLTPLTTGTEILALAPATTSDERLAAILAAADTVVMYKAGRTLSRVLDLCQAADKVALVGSEVSLPDEHLSAGADLAQEARRGYFTAVLATRADRTTSLGSLA